MHPDDPGASARRERLAALIGDGRWSDPDAVDAQLARVRAQEPELFRELMRVLGTSGSLLADHGLGDPGISLQPAPSAHTGSGDDADSSGAVLERIEEHRLRGGRYRLLGELGHGGMGDVFEVWDEDLRRRQAMKVVRRDADEGAGRDELRLSRFLEEAQVTGQLEHPGIPPVHELGVDAEGRVYFTMQLIQGMDLSDVLELASRGQEGWTRERVLGVLLRVCEAVAFAHDKGVVHRDLKPANIRVGRFGQVYVIDWGLARVLGRDEPSEEREAPGLSHVWTDRKDTGSHAASPFMTTDGDVMGTPSYMSPEQARGKLEEIGPRSDEYALGAILYELLTGDKPYVPAGTRPTAHTIWSCLLDGAPRPVLELAPGTPLELVAICEKAMQRDPLQRYADVEGLGADLRAYLENRVVRAHRTGAFVELRKWVARNRVVAAAVLGFFSVSLLAAGVFAWGERRLARRTQLELDVRTAAALIEEADELWPVHPASVPRLAEWLAHATDLEARRPAYVARGREQLGADPPPFEPDPMRADEIARVAGIRSEMRARLDAAEAHVSAGASPSFDPVDPALALEVLPTELERLDRQLARLEVEARRTQRFAGPGAGLARMLRDLGVLFDGEDSVLARVRARLARAEGLRAASIEAGRSAWAEAMVSIADEGQCPAYAGLELSPQLGLLPLRQDQESGLWEFLHCLSGAAPEEDDGGRWAIGAQTGIVLVLIPAGESPSAQGLAGGVPLDAFFLSKYELTQGQWLRLTDALPAQYPSGSQDHGMLFTRRHPVESVSQREGERMLARWNLRLPTNAQWDFAAFALDSRWREVGGESSVANFLGRDFGTDAVRDRWEEHAPVDALHPSPFGLHMMFGNVGEWTRDWHQAGDSSPARPGDGLRTPDLLHAKAFRGGSFWTPEDKVGLFLRFATLPGYTDADVGLRPMRPIHPPDSPYPPSNP